ncbi:MAG: T9SS type A sorting domain-containing protein [Flavobacteriales bacterium]|nr:T9SS type A sorting domain-containing protein [Flavobacteriales bacterium]
MRPLILVLLVLHGFHTHAQCVESTRTRVLLVGDSWAFFMGVDQTINEVLNKWGHSNYRYYTNLTLAENGAETDDFLQPGKLAEIQARLDADPDLRVVHLSLGGNDVLGDWHTSFTPAQTDSLKAAVYDRLLTVITLIKDMRPDIHILWSGYMYPNFQEVIEDLGFLQTLHPFYGLWSGMGFPTFEQLNVILNEFTAEVIAYCATDPRVDHVDATGLMQYAYGQNAPLGVPPGGSYPPLTAPLPHGFVDYPSPKSSMRNYGLTLDCFHLSATGYRHMIEQHARKFYQKFLMNDQVSVAMPGNVGGTVSNMGTVLPDFKVGSQSGEHFATLLSFPVGAALGQPLQGASIFLRREALSGSDPLAVTLNVKVRSGHFGGSAAVEPVDYWATADASGAPCRFGSNAGNGHWTRLELPQSLLPHITNGTTVQFLIQAPGAPNGLITFTGADDPELAPVLDLTYGDLSTAIEAVEAGNAAAPFPNPTAGQLHVPAQEEVITGIVVHDLTGRTVWERMGPVNVVDLSHLPAGVYLVDLIKGIAKETHRVVKW